MTALQRFTDQDGRRRVLDAIMSQQLVNGSISLAEALVAEASLHRYSAGDIILQQGTFDNDILFILTGEVSVQVNGRQVATRRHGQHIGELAMLDPSVPRSATIVATAEVVVAKVSEAAFIAASNRDLLVWQRLAREIAERLRQRNSGIVQPRERPVVFVGSSSEGLPVAEALKACLASSPLEVVLWSEDVFAASEYTLESLETALKASDFAVLVATPDDTRTSRGTESTVPRDNVVLEAGLFMGALGRKRTFILEPSGGRTTLPSDLRGMTTLRYARVDGSITPEHLESVCHSIQRYVTELGPR